MATCSGCGIEVADANILYTGDARIVCAKCYAQEDIIATDKRAAHNIRNAAVAAAGGGIASFFSPLSGMMIVVIACVVATFVSGIYALQSLSRGNERFTKHLTSGDRMLIWVCCIFGFVLSGFMALIVLAGFSFIF